MSEPTAEISDALKKKLKTIQLVIDNEQYDVTQFASKHPGNNYGDAGTLWQYKNQDVSDLFAKYHCDGASKADEWLAKARADKAKGFMGIVHLGTVRVKPKTETDTKTEPNPKRKTETVPKTDTETEKPNSEKRDTKQAEKVAVDKVEPSPPELATPDKTTGSRAACCVQ